LVRWIHLYDVFHSNEERYEVLWSTTLCSLIARYKILKVATWLLSFWHLMTSNTEEFSLVLAIAQAVGHRFPNASARLQSQARSDGICGGRSGTGVGVF
jgi:hypothetical protein